MNMNLTLTPASVENLDFSSALYFSHTLFNDNFSESLSLSGLGVELSASLSASLFVEFYANLIIPAPTFNFSFNLSDSAIIDDSVLVGEQVTVDTGGVGFENAFVISAFDLSAFDASVGFNVEASASLTNFFFDAPAVDPVTFEDVDVSYNNSFELLGFGLTANQEGDYFRSDITFVRDYLNDNIPVDQLLTGNAVIPATGLGNSLLDNLPIDLAWDFTNIGYGPEASVVEVDSFNDGNFTVTRGSGANFLSASIDLDDILGLFLGTGSNPLLSPFEANFSATFLDETSFETEFQFFATLIDLDVNFGLELVQQTQFVQTGTAVTVYDGNTVVATGELGDTLIFDGLDVEGVGSYDIEYTVLGEVTTSWGFRLNIDVPVELFSVAAWIGDLEFYDAPNGFTEPLIPDEDAINYVGFSEVFRIFTSEVITIDATSRTTAVELNSDRERFDVTFVDDDEALTPSASSWTISPNAAGVTEGVNAEMVFTIRRTNTSEAETVFVSTDPSRSSAEASDYGTLNQVAVNFAAGVVSVTVSVDIVDDQVVENNETVAVRLENSTGDVLARGISTIIDNDVTPPPVVLPELSVSNASVTEADFEGAILRFTVSSNRVSDEDIIFNATTVFGSTTNLRDGFGNRDYESFVNRAFTIEAGETSTVVEVVLRVDDLPERTEAMELHISSVINATLRDGVGVGTIIDNDSELIGFPNGLVSGQVAAGETNNYRFITDGYGTFTAEAFDILGDVNLRVLDYLGNELLVSNASGTQIEQASVEYTDGQLYFLEISGVSNSSSYSLSLSPPVTPVIDPNERPDLILDAVTSNGQVIQSSDTLENDFLAGGIVDLELVVRNIGDNISPTSLIEVFISVNGSAIKLADFAAASLDPNADAFIENLDFNLPDNLADGRYNLAVIIDRADDIDELDELNNGIGFSLNIVSTTTLEPPVVDSTGNQADIVVTNAFLRNPVITEGDEAVIEYDVLNRGGEGSGAFSVGFTLSLDQIFGNEDDVYLELDGVRALAAGDTENGFDVLNYTSNLSAGTYYIFSNADQNDSVDESNEFNNASSAATLIVQRAAPIVPPGPTPESDQVITDISISTPRIDPGDRPTISVTIENTGNAETGNTQLAYYISNTPIFQDATYLGNRSVSIDADTTLTETLAIPTSWTDNLPTGETYYIFAVANDEEAGTEQDFSDNISAPIALRIRGNGPSDLNVLNTSIDVQTIDRGDRPLFTTQVENIGDQEAGVVRLGIYISETDNFEDAVFVGDRGLRSGLNDVSTGLYRLSSEFTETLTPGQTYYLFGVANSDREGSEVNYSNNLTDSVSFTVNAVPPPDQQVTLFEINTPEIAPADNLVLDYALANYTNEATGETTLGFYVSESGLFGDAELISERAVEILAGGDLSGSLTLREDFTTALQSDTTYTFFVVANHESVGQETNFSNNTSAGIDVYVRNNSPSDQALTSIAAEASIVFRGDDFVVGYSVQNLGDRATGNTELALFISSDANGQGATLVATQSLELLAGQFDSGEFVLSPEFTAGLDSGASYYFFIVANNSAVGSEVEFDNNQSAVDVFTVVSGTAANVSVSTSLPIYLQGNEGDDDVIRGGDEAEQIVGLSGPDQLFGNGGDDILVGGQGRDLLDGGLGDDILNGGTGNDRLNGGMGNDLLDGGNNADQLSGDGGNDVLIGARGEDRLDGGAGLDRLEGGTGNDSLFGGTGQDILIGGSGNDLLDGWTGFDTALYTGLSEGVIVDLNITSSQDTGGGGIDTLVRVENLIGSSHDDVLSGTSNRNRLEGGSGDDSLYGEGNNDVLIGGSGEDRLVGGFGADRLIGGSDDDVLYGNSQRDRLEGGTGNDQLFGGADVDRLLGGSGNDVLNGGEGTDFLFGGAGNDTFVFTDTSESGIRPYQRDEIRDWNAGDLIDVSGIDANELLAGNQAFSLVEDGFSGTAGEIWIESLTRSGVNVQLVHFDVDGDGQDDMQIWVIASELVAADFVM